MNDIVVKMAYFYGDRLGWIEGIESVGLGEIVKENQLLDVILNADIETNIR